MSDILQFPQRDKGRIRKRRSAEAMGRCTIGMLERDGEGVPENVADIRSAKSPTSVAEGAMALRLATAVFAVLTKDQKDSIRTAVRTFARHDDGVIGDECRALYDIILGEPRC